MHCCISAPTADNNTSSDMIWVTLNMGRRVPRTVGEMSWNCQGISHCLESGHLAYWHSEVWCQLLCFCASTSCAAVAALCFRLFVPLSRSLSRCVFNILRDTWVVSDSSPVCPLGRPMLDRSAVGQLYRYPVEQKGSDCRQAIHYAFDNRFRTTSVT